MATTVDVRLGKMKGVDASSDQLSTLSLSTNSTVYEGSILYEDSSTADALKVATLGTTAAEFLLLERVTADGPTFLERMFRVDVGEKASGRKAGVILLRPGMEFETKVAATTGTGALSSGTPLETALSVISGEIVVKQASGNGSVEFGRLKENALASTGFVRVHVTHVGH